MLKMKKTIKLTEADLKELVKRVIKEQIAEKPEGIREFNEHFLLIQNADAEVVEGALNELPDTIRFIAIVNCEFADFGNLDLCNDFNDIMFVNLQRTPNNFEETQAGCYKEIADNMWDFLDKDVQDEE